MSYAEEITIKNADGTEINPSTEDLQRILMLLLDRLDYGLLTDTSKRLRVAVEQATAANLQVTIGSGTVTTVASVTAVANQTRMGDIQTQRLVEALVDTAFNTGIINNLSF